MEKSYKLEIGRNQYDRIAEVFREPNGLIPVSYDLDKDTVTFTISEKLRLHFAKFARLDKTWNPKSQKKANRYWLSQMFLPRNIEKYLVKRQL